MRSVNEVGASLGTKMLWEIIDGANVEPPKAIRGFVLYHPCDDALATILHGQLSHHLKKEKRNYRQNKIAGRGRGQDGECNGVIGLRIRYLRRPGEGAL